MFPMTIKQYERTGTHLSITFDNNRYQFLRIKKGEPSLFYNFLKEDDCYELFDYFIEMEPGAEKEDPIITPPKTFFDDLHELIKKIKGQKK
jgi:hypothetical protein